MSQENTVGKYRHYRIWGASSMFNENINFQHRFEVEQAGNWRKNQRKFNEMSLKQRYGENVA